MRKLGSLEPAALAVHADRLRRMLNDPYTEREWHPEAGTSYTPLYEQLLAEDNLCWDVWPVQVEAKRLLAKLA